MLKKIFIAVPLIILISCSDNKSQEKALLNEVIKMHDGIMNDDGIIMKNKMQLKTIAASSTPGIKDSVAYYSKLLNNADDVMMGWMNKFNPDFIGKSHHEIMDYLNNQKIQIVKINSQLNVAIASSNKFISRNKVK